MNQAIDKSYGANPVEVATKINEDNCEKKIMKMELTLAAFVLMEKINTNTATFSGPPPIPKNADSNPRTRPTHKMTKRFCT